MTGDFLFVLSLLAWAAGACAVAETFWGVFSLDLEQP